MNKKEFFDELYRQFNAREIENVLSKTHDDVKWANGMEGGFVYGHDAVREYWTRQFSMVNPRVEPQNVETDGDVSTITVHQTVKDLDGNLLSDATVKHIFHLENDLVKTFELEEYNQANFETRNQ